MYAGDVDQRATQSTKAVGGVTRATVAQDNRPAPALDHCVQDRAVVDLHRLLEHHHGSDDGHRELAL
ncbi:MAG TPA: hypothetical protein VE623_16870 [Acidimicrobiales bacterium]|jgi:hypothetical protein|nr:hypothetical protein [Acidimicrobiales bacterium]